LITKRTPASAAHSPADLIDIHGEFLGRVPRSKVSKISHAELSIFVSADASS
jgi:hypothetical protein